MAVAYPGRAPGLVCRWGLAHPTLQNNHTHTPRPHLLARSQPHLLLGWQAWRLQLLLKPLHLLVVGGHQLGQLLQLRVALAAGRHVRLHARRAPVDGGRRLQGGGWWWRLVVAVGQGCGET